MAMKKARSSQRAKAPPAPARTEERSRSAWENVAHIEPENRTAWRGWLAANHDRSTGVWVVYRRASTGLRGLPYDAAVEEALCFGWIDTTVRPIDNERYKQMFTPRKAKSTWSALNKQRVERLLAAGLMHVAGLARIEASKKDGSWFAMDAVESLALPAEFEKALAANSAAKKNFGAFSPSVKKMYLRRINSAKRPETRAKRIAELVDMAARNLRRFE
jgi:uncharacterized protein YdeI (YjbR/CyaY-like superfamily)